MQILKYDHFDQFLPCSKLCATLAIANLLLNRDCKSDKQKLKCVRKLCWVAQYNFVIFLFYSLCKIITFFRIFNYSPLSNCGGSINLFSNIFLRLQFITTPLPFHFVKNLKKSYPQLMSPPPSPIQLYVGKRKCFQEIFLIQAGFQSQFHPLKTKICTFGLFSHIQGCMRPY